MKRFIFLFALIFSGVMVNAQATQTTEQAPAQTPEQHAHAQAMHLQKLVSTNDDQTQKAEAIFLERDKAIQAILNDGTKTAQEQQDAIAKVKADKDVELSQVLTADQYAVYRHKMEQLAARKTLTQ